MREEFNQMDEILETIIKNPDTHGRWLNTISFLEHIGSRKILLTQDISYMNESMLRHIAEEARHASFFKSLISQTGIALPDYSSENLFCGFASSRYFQGLDIAVQKELVDIEEDKEYFYLCYLYVSNLIEERADWLYTKYNAILQRNNSSISLTAIILEEERHLDVTHRYLLENDPDYSSRMDRLRVGENLLFDRFYLSLMQVSGV